MPDGGYEVDPQLLQSAAQTVSDAPKEQLQTPLPSLRDIRISRENLGPGHGTSHSIYVSGVESVIACVDAYLAASESFANGLSSAGRKYSAAEEQTQSDINQAGGF